MTPGNGSSQEAECTDCRAPATSSRELFLVAANYGEGAFLQVLCEVCDHRRWYRGQLLDRLTERANGHEDAPELGAWS